MILWRRSAPEIPPVESSHSILDIRENVLVRMRPERWLAVDYAKQFGDAP